MRNTFTKGLAGILLAGSLFSTNTGAAERKTVKVSTNIVQRAASYQPQRPANPNIRQQTNLLPEHIEIEGKDYPNPKYLGNDMFKKDSERMILARTLYGEARGELDNEDYVYGVARSIINRAKRMNRTIKESALSYNTKVVKDKNGKEREIKTYAYSCFDAAEGLLPKLRNPIAHDSKVTWKRCYEIAGESLQGNLEGKENLDRVTNYYVGQDAAQYRTKREAEQKGIPSWAYQMKNGRFVLDEKKRRIPRRPLAEIPVNVKGNKKAYFYSFEYF